MDSAMKAARETPAGALTILLQFDPYTVQGAKLCIPMLGIDEHIRQFTQYDRLPAGVYPGTLVAVLTTGEEVKQNIRIKILPNQGNLHEFKLAGPPHEVIVRPVDADNKTIVYSEIKIENVDMNFRPVRDEHGIVCRIRPGEYQVQVILPNLEIKTLPLKVTNDTQVYTLTIADKHSETRQEQRVQVKLPMDYKISEGIWISTETVNISATGVCLIKRQWNLDDEEMQVRLFLPVTIAPIECPGRVRWVRDEGTADARMGMELFLTQSIRNSLKKWLNAQTKKTTKVNSM
jgi:hypothetical protein